MAIQKELKTATEWAIKQDNVIFGDWISHESLVDNVRKYMNDNKISYDTFSYEDVKPFILNPDQYINV